MSYIVLEMQTNNGITAIVPPCVYANQKEAESKFHAVLAAAAVSNVEEHTAIQITHEGKLVRPPECYYHPTTPPILTEE